MEDAEFAIFNSEPRQIIYKQLLDPLEVSALNNYCTTLTLERSHETGLATGQRQWCDINLRDQRFSFLCDRLFVTLENYFIDLRVDPNARFYSHKYGAVKPHTDKNHDNMSNYTLLLYLNDDFEGRLSIKTKRTEAECIHSHIDKLHKVFQITPMRGYAIIFDKNLLHWSSETYTDKNFILIHLYSACGGL